MYNVLEVCRHVINYSNIQDYGISNLKLQKILYFIQAYFLICTSQPCFNEEIQAWDFGPVVPEAYQEYKQYGSGDIPFISSYVENNSNNIWDLENIEFEDDIISDNDKNLIDAVIDKFADYSATDLVEITHNQAPWKNAYIHGKNVPIHKKDIKDYFDEK